MDLSGKERRHLRALGHELKPVLQIGKEGVTDAFVAALAQALLDHELIKVRVLGNSPVERQEAAELVAFAAGADVAQVLGNHILLYKPHPETPTIVLPGQKAAKPARPAKAPKRDSFAAKQRPAKKADGKERKKKGTKPDFRAKKSFGAKKDGKPGKTGKAGKAGGKKPPRGGR